ncbi:MAG TPA: NUDIX domain-containing protein [Kribbella sp.]|nr:NUDIX domain-containing protein [Kribbella sp.]
MPVAKKGDAVNFPSYPHEVLAVVLSVRDGALCVLLWKRGRSPFKHRWALPGGGVRPTERLREAITGHLAEKVDVREVAHLEQLATHSAIDRDPRARVLATAYLGLVPSNLRPNLPADTAWHPVDELPHTAFDHHFFIEAAVARLRAKLSYTNIGFALAPPEFTIAELRDLFSAALGYELGATNLTRVLTRRDHIVATDRTATHGQSGGRPATVYKFVTHELTVTDPFAVLRPRG